MKKKCTAIQETIKEIFWKEYLTVKFGNRKLIVKGKNVGVEEAQFRDKIATCLEESKDIIKVKEKYEVTETKNPWPLISWRTAELEVI